MQKTLEKRGLSYELVLVANYKPEMKGIDMTPEIVRAFAQSDPRIVAVARTKEGMMGWDMRSGLEKATGETIAVIDGDGQMPPEDVVKVYDALMLHKSDMAKTYREHRFDGTKRVIISKVYNFLFRILFPKLKVRDVNSKPKIFTREALSKLNLTSDGWFIDAEMIINAGRKGLTVVEVPTDFYIKKDGVSLIGTAAIFEFIKNLLLFRIRPK
jgi:glycosyltransferase involved in cell wall biosynthesis